MHPTIFLSTSSVHGVERSPWVSALSVTEDVGRGLASFVRGFGGRLSGMKSDRL